MFNRHRFMLIQGEAPTEIVERNLDQCPYKETHKGETGVVFFTDHDLAVKYQESRPYLKRLILASPDDPETVVRASTKHGCNVAFLIRHGAGGKVTRDVMELE